MFSLLSYKNSLFKVEIGIGVQQAVSETCSLSLVKIQLVADSVGEDDGLFSLLFGFFVLWIVLMR